MSYYADPIHDLPAPWKAKRIIFYAQGLKIYGQIPYILQRKLQAKFISNNASLFGGRIIGPTGEHNYTIVLYRRDDGALHSEATRKALLDWLYADKGFEFGIAAPDNFNDELGLVNWFNQPPRTVRLATAEQHSMVARLLTGHLEAINEGSS